MNFQVAFGVTANYVRMTSLHEEIVHLEKQLTRKRMELAHLLEPNQEERRLIEENIQELQNLAKPKETIISEEVEERG